MKWVVILHGQESIQLILSVSEEGMKQVFLEGIPHMLS